MKLKRGQTVQENFRKDQLSRFEFKNVEKLRFKALRLHGFKHR